MSGKQNRGMLIAILLLTVLSAIVAFRDKVPLIGDTRARYGLDIQGGMRVVLRAKKEDYKGRWTAENLEAVRRILDNRVNATGVAEPAIMTKPDDQVIIELPGLKNKQEALERLQSTASLQFYLLPMLDNGTWQISRRVDPVTKVEEEILVDSSGKELTPEQKQLLIFDKDPIVTGNELLPTSQAVLSPSTSKPVITFEFNAKGSEIFDRTTRANIGKHLAIFLDKRLLTAPTINSPIAGKGEIEGAFTLQSAKLLSEQLNAGALPVPLVVEEVRDIEATLGRESVTATTRAGIIGLIFVLVFMLYYYRLPGILANAALLLYSLFSIAVFKGALKGLGIEPITLTLPGIAGFILSIGMAVDANILIFERLKEELRSGKTLRNAIDVGFKRAFTAIFDSNVCTAMTCAVLYNFGTGPIRGFALTLGIGVAISMFTAITVTRTFLFWLVGMKFAQNPALYGVAGEAKIPNFRFMQNYRLWLGISIALIVPGLLAWGAGGIKRSIEFQGGTELALPFAHRHAAPEIQKALSDLSPRYKDSRVVVSSEQSGVYRAYVTTVKLSDAERQQVITGLTQKIGDLAPGQTGSYANVSGVISAELTLNAILSVAFASILILLYLAFRFSIGGFKEGLKYGACALASLLHDVLVLWGSFAILGKIFDWQIDSLFVTAMLTVIGFSVHDTIVVFDRIRENLHHRLKGETFIDLTDRSISQTWARSIRTSATVVITLLALFFAGGATIHQFTGALLIGIVSGTYSSIFNASVLLSVWKRNDTLVTAGGPKSALAPKSVRTAPGDRPLVAPTEKPASASETENAETAETEKRSAPRRQPVRRRRM